MFKWIKNLFDTPEKRLRNAQSSTQFISMRMGTLTQIDNGVVVGGEPPPPDTREECRPVDILKEFEVDVEVNMDDLQRKLDELLKHSDFHHKTLKRRNIPAEVEHAINYLKARKTYPKLANQIPWRTTTQRRINKMMADKKLEHKPIAEFMPEFPDAAISEIKKFEVIWRKATKGVIGYDDNVPELDLSIIAPPEMFRKESKDPILLAKSPYGEFFYILCAWDEEVDFVGELLGEEQKE